jgi:PH-interacting protein
MVPLADLDMVIEPPPEFIDVMDWEPEIDVFANDTDSEYNLTDDSSSRGEKGGSSSNASGDPGSSTDNSDNEDIHMDSIRRSKRKKQKTGVSTLIGNIQ